jgi:hypothetical protein
MKRSLRSSVSRTYSIRHRLAHNINSPTVIRMVTAIMVLPVSIPLLDAVSPPARESLDYTIASSLTPHDLRENEARTGTGYSALVTTAMKAVPPNRRE